MITELVFLIVLFVIIVEINFDIGVLFAIIVFICVVIDNICCKRNLVILKYANQKKIYREYILILALQIVMTLISMPFEYSEFMQLGIKTFFANSILLLIINGYFISYINVKEFLELFKICGISVACLGFIETLLRRNILPLQMGNYNVNSFGTEYFRVVLFFGHPTIAAIFFVIVIVTLLYTPLKNNIMQTISLFTLFIALYGTKTRIMWLGVVVILLLYFADKIDNNNRKRVIGKKNLIYGVVMVIAILVVMIYFLPILVNVYKELRLYLLLMFDQNNNYDSRIVRISNILNAVDYWKKNPVSFLLGQGVGFDKTFSVNNRVTLNFGEIWNSGMDNQYITLVLQAGILPAFIYIKIVIETIKKFFETKSRIIKIAALYVVTIGVASISMDSFGWRMCVYFLQIGILIINRGMKEKWTE